MSDAAAPHRAALRRRWRVRVVLVLAALVQVFACQAVLAPSMGAAAVVSHEAGHGVGHDVRCEAGPAPLSAPTTCRDTAGELPVPAAGDVLGLALAVAGLLAVTLVAAARTGSAAGAPRLVPPGRQRLLAVGLIRV